MAKKTVKKADKAAAPAKAIKDMNAEEIAAAKTKANTNGNKKRIAALNAAGKALDAKTDKTKANPAPDSDIIDSNKDELFKNIGAAGTVTKGTTLGKTREIVGPELPGSKDAEKTTIAPTEKYGASAIDSLEKFGGSTIDQGMSNEMRARQQAFAGQLEQQSLGQGPSVAGLQLKAATDRNIAQQQALAASSNGVGRLLAQRRAAVTTAGLGQDAARQAALARMTEQLNAQTLLGTQQQNIRASDIGVASNQAGLTNTAGIATMEEQAKRAAAQATLTQSAAAGNATAVNNQAVQQGVLDQATSAQNQTELNKQLMNQAQLQANADRYNQTEVNAAKIAQANVNAGILNTGTSAAAGVAGAKAGAAGTVSAAGIAAGADKYGTDAEIAAQKIQDEQNQQIIDFNKAQADKAAGKDKLDTIGKGVGAVATAVPPIIDLFKGSDRRTKTDIAPADAKMKGFLDELQAYDFKYKEGDGKTNNGVMAQDLEKSEVGSEMVKDTPGGKMVDYGKGFSSILAAQAMLNKRLAALEGKKKAA